MFDFLKKSFCKNADKIFTTDCLNTVKNCPNFLYNPFIFYIKNKADFLLDKVLKNFELLEMIPIIGLEIEFYLIDKNIKIESFFEEIYNFSKTKNIEISKIEKERGKNQIEIKTVPYKNIKKLINDFYCLKEFLQKNYNVSFRAQEYLSDAGSALQLNLNFIDKNSNNLFARTINEFGEKVESIVLEQAISGILSTTNIFLPCYIKDENCLNRFNFEINNNIYKSGKIPAPTFLAWGVNNRTAVIRIPTPLNFDNYDYYDNKSRRIEFRVPSADADIKLSTFSLLISSFYGISEKLNPIEKSNFNIITQHKNLKKVEIENTSFLSDDFCNFFEKYIIL